MGKASAHGGAWDAISGNGKRGCKLCGAPRKNRADLKRQGIRASAPRRRVGGHFEKWKRGCKLCGRPISSRGMLAAPPAGACGQSRFLMAVAVNSLSDMDTGALTGWNMSAMGRKRSMGRHLFVPRGENEVSLQRIHCYASYDLGFIRCAGFGDHLIPHPRGTLQIRNGNAALRSNSRTIGPPVRRPKKSAWNPSATNLEKLLPSGAFCAPSIVMPVGAKRGWYTPSPPPAQSPRRQCSAARDFRPGTENTRWG